MRGIVPYPVTTHKRELQRVGQGRLGVALMPARDHLQRMEVFKPIRVAPAQCIMLAVHLTNML